jgi:hypothetical protein
MYFILPAHVRLLTQIMTFESADPHALAEGRKINNVVRSILAEDGMRGLFAGAAPRSGWWFCVCSIFFATFERVRSQLDSAIA